MLVCGGCSPDTDFVHGYLDKKVRVCKACFNFKLKRIHEINQIKSFVSLKNNKKK